MNRKYWKQICAIPAYMFLLSPSGTRIQKLEGGNWIDQHEAQKVVDEAEDELRELRDRCAQQAAMIEHLRGGPTPLYTAVDMANAARDGFRDGAESRDAEIERLKNHIQSMIDQTTPLVPLEGHPGWSRRITIDELQAKVAELSKNSDRYLWLRNKASVEDWNLLSDKGGDCVDQTIDSEMALYDPEQIVMAISEERSRAISKRGRDALVEGCTAVDFNVEQMNKALAGERFTKPENQTREQFREWMLQNASSLNEALKKDAERYRWLRDKAPKIPFATPLIAMFNANGQLEHRREGLPLLVAGAKADFIIDQAAAKYTDSEIEEERGRQQAKIDAAITTLNLSSAMLFDDNPLKKAFLVQPKTKE